LQLKGKSGLVYECETETLTRPPVKAHLLTESVPKHYALSHRDNYSPTVSSRIGEHGGEKTYSFKQNKTQSEKRKPTQT